MRRPRQAQIEHGAQALPTREQFRAVELGQQSERVSDRLRPVVSEWSGFHAIKLRFGQVAGLFIAFPCPPGNPPPGQKSSGGERLLPLGGSTPDGRPGPQEVAALKKAAQKFLFLWTWGVAASLAFSTEARWRALTTVLLWLPADPAS